MYSAYYSTSHRYYIEGNPNMFLYILTSQSSGDTNQNVIFIPEQQTCLAAAVVSPITTRTMSRFSVHRILWNTVTFWKLHHIILGGFLGHRRDPKSSAWLDTELPSLEERWRHERLGSEAGEALSWEGATTCPPTFYHYLLVRTRHFIFYILYSLYLFLPNFSPRNCSRRNTVE